MEKKQFLNKKNLILGGLIIALALIVAIVSIFAISTNKIEIDSELAKAMTYTQVAEGEEATNSDYVKFDAFFLRDLDGDGYTESLRGTCKEVGTEDTLYMELKVVTNGYFENGVITVNSDNFYFNTKIPKDTQIKDNAIGVNVEQITFNQISSGTQKLLTGMVRSGNYSYVSQKYDALGNNPSNYSKVNSVTLTGTHVADDGTRTEISKTVEFDVDWYGSTNAELPEWIETNTDKYYKNQSHDISEIFDEENNEIKLDFEILTRETYNDLFLSKAEIQADIPDLNGYAPNNVEVVGTNVTYTYDPTTKLLVAQREAKLNDEGFVVENAFSIQTNGRRYNKFNVIVTYPLEAYDTLGADSFSLRIPVRAYNYGYNNPNEEFTNPYVSEVAKDTVVLNYSHPVGDVALFRVYVGKLAYNPYVRYFVSKEKPLNIYNNITDEETDDNYFVTWFATTGTDGESNGIVMKESKDGQSQVSDYFIKNDATDESMANLLSNVGIALGNPEGLLGENGWVKVYDEETGNLLVTFDKNNWNEYDKSNTYKYEVPVKNIRVETSATKASSYMYVYNEKNIDVEYITENYTREEFDAFSYIATTLQGYLDGVHINTAEHQAFYEDPMSVLKVYVSPDTYSTQATEKNVRIAIVPESSTSYNEVEWQNATFLVKIPEEIVSLKINNVTTSNSNVEVSAYELYEENNCKYIKIITSNEEPQVFTLYVNLDITPDPRGGTVSKAVEVYAINEYCENYYYNGKDTYDLDGDGNVEELLAKNSDTVNLVAPNTLLTSQLVKNYDDLGTETIAPEVAVLTKQQKTATIEFDIRNNYTNTVSEIQILGKVPKVGNGYAISNSDLGSQFSVNMTADGIKVPEELANYAKVYYSANEKATKDLNKSENGWTQEVSDWSTVKTYLIVLDGYVMDKNISHIFTYQIELPSNVEYNQLACSHHGIYFCLDTVEGKYKTNTEPNKLGLLVAREFNLNLSKYQEDTEKLIPGATYSITEQGTEDSKIRTTNSNGNILIEKLYVERTYVIKEVKTPEQYELNENEVVFKVIENDDGSLSITDTTGETRNGLNLSVDTEGNDVISVEVEDRVKPNINIIKTIENTDIAIEDIKYKLTGKGITSKGKILKTDSNGNADAIGLYLDEEYELQEVIAKGYYIPSKIKFTITNNEGNYSLNILEGTIKNYTITTNDEIPTLNIEIENEPIPTYTLNINKIVAGETTPLEGAEFILLKEGQEVGSYTSDVDGKIKVSGLYAYEADKGLNQTYTLREKKAPAGYAKLKDIIFTVTHLDGEYTVDISTGKVKEAKVEGSEVTFTIENSPTFVLKKVDRDTGESLADVKFVIIDEETGEFAKNGKGEYVGEAVEKYGQISYVVTTDSNGEIKLDLVDGLYRAVEIEVGESYIFDTIESRTNFFGIGMTREEANASIVQEDIYESTYYNTPNDMNYETSSYSSTNYMTTDAGYNNGNDYINKVAESVDGGYFGVGQIEGAEVILPNGTIATSTDHGMAFTVKYNEIGGIEWFKAIDGEGHIEISDVKGTADGGCLILGSFGDEVITFENRIELYPMSSWETSMVVKYDADGNVQWAKPLGSNDYNRFESLDITEDGGFVIAGCTGDYDFYADYTKVLESEFYDDAVILKYDANGNYEMGAMFGGAGRDRFNTVKATADGGAIAVGGFESSEIVLDANHTIYKDLDTSSDSMIVKFAADGSIEWVNTLPDLNPTFAVAETMEGNFLVGFDMMADITILPDGTEVVRESEYLDVLLIRYDKDGNFVNYRTISHLSSNYINDINVYEDDSYTLAMDIAGYAVVEKYDKNDQFVWTVVKYDERYDDCASITNVVKLNNGEYVAGGTYGENWGVHYGKRFDGPFDGVIWKIRTDGIAEDSELSVGNAKKRYWVSTEVDDYYGGYITGQEYYPFEIVEHGDSNKLQITMYPYDGYEIAKITINGEEQQFEPQEDGTYILPTITNITEDKHIVVYYVYSAEKVVINKVDETTGEGLEGAKFYIEQVEERDEPVNVLGTLTDNSSTYTVGDLDNEITDTAMGDLTGNSATYYTADYDNEVTGVVEDLTDNAQEYVYTDENIDLSTQIGALTDAGVESTILNDNNEITEVLGELTNNGTYYFVKDSSTGYYVPTNSKTYQTANGGTAGIVNSTANSYMTIDLTDYEGTYGVRVDASIISENNYDFGYATITNSTTAPTYNSSTGRFMYIAGNQSEKAYTYTELQGGNIYYLHFGYRKDTSTDTGEDRVIIKNVRVYETVTSIFNFIENENGGYESTNQGHNKSVSNSYVPIDLTNYEGKYRLRVNLTASAASGDYSYLTVTNTADSVEYNNSQGRFAYISGSVTGQNYETLLEGGQIYYLHMGYYKGSGTHSGDDKVTINSINLYGTYSEFYNFIENENGGYESTNQDKQNTVGNSYVKIDLTNYTGTYNVVVNAEISSQSSNDFGYVTATTSTDRPSYNTASGRLVYISGEVEAKDYEYTLTGGNIYYIHMGYYKNSSTNAGDDKFTVNSIKVYQGKEIYYNFEVDEDGRYVSSNQGVKNTTSTSYIPIDLTNYEGTYKLNIAAFVSSQNGYDYGYATITNSTTAPTYNATTGRILCISGTQAIKEYTTTLTGGSVYYLHLGFYKSIYSNTSTGNDTFTVSYIRLAPEATKTFGFIESDGKYISTNQGYANTISTSYISLDLTNYEGRYLLTINAEIDSQSDNDYGYVHATTTTTASSYNTSASRVFRISGQQEAKDYTYILAGGKVYYIHMGYYKNGALNTGTDTFTINSIQLTLSDIDLYRGYATTDINGQAITELPYGIYKITEITAPEGYILNETPTEIEFRADTTNEFTITNSRDGRVVVHHYYKDTTDKVAEDEIIDGHVGEEYTTLPQSSTAEYELEKDENGEYILPDNANGTFVSGDTEVIYYYVRNNIPLTVNHYIDGTIFEVPLQDGTTKETEKDSGVEGEEYTTTQVKETELNEKYKLVETPANATGIYEYEDVIVTYYYDVKTFDVTTDVNGEGGTISGQGKSSYENVEYGEDSQKEIIATPADLHQVSSITVNGEEIEFTENADKTVTLNKFTSMTEDKNVVVTFEAIQGEVTVHHYEAIANEDGTYTYTQNKVVEDEVKIGNIGDIFATKESEFIPEYYEFLEAVEPTSGEYTEEPIEVVYYYKYKKYDYTVEYYYDGIKDDSKTDVKQEIYLNQVTDYEDKVIDGYKFERVDGTPLEISTIPENNVIKVYYVKDSFEYSIEYYYEGVKDDSKTETNTAVFEEEIIDYEDKVIDGYKFERTEKNPLKITSDSTANVMKVYYVKDSFEYSVEYYYEGVKDDSKTETNTAVFEEEIVDYEDKVIDGYKFERTENNPLKITSDSTVNIMKVYYVKDSFEYSIEYYYEGIKDDSKTEINTAIFEEEIVDYEDKVIDGYKFERTENNPLKITSDSTTNVMKVYYVKDSFEYGVEYYYEGVKDDSKTVTGTALFEEEITNFEQKPIDGYKFERTENNPLKITSDSTANVMKVYYIKDRFAYTVEYYYDGVKDDSKTDTNIAKFEAEITDYTDKVIDGYKFERVENTPLKITSDETTNVIKVYYIRNVFGYSVEYYYNDVKDDDATETSSATFAETIDTYTDKAKTGYKFERTDNYPLTITSDETANIIKVFYTTDEAQTKQVSYTVEYYKEGIFVENEVFTEDIQVLAEEIVTVKKGEINVTDKYFGYKFVNTNPEVIPDTIANKGIIKVYYEIDEAQTKELSYTVEYYKDGVLTDTEVEKTTVQVLQPDTMSVVKDKINVTDKYYGYKFVNTDPETIPDEIANGGIIKVYYELDSENVKQLKYTVEYYKDGVFAESEETTEIVQILDGDTLEVIKDSINTVDKYYGYKFANTDPETIPDTVNDGDIIKVYYVTDEAQTKELSYTVEYYKDGVLTDTEVEKTTVQVLQPDTMSVAKDKINVTDKYDGYKFIGTDPEEIPDTVSNGDIIKVNYEKDTFEYTVEYYYEGIKDDSKTETSAALFEEVINTYTDKVEVGYKFDRVEGTPLTITSNPANNVIKVYYVIDEAQTKEIKYTVEYYKDGILADTEEFTEVVQVFAEENLTVRKDEINVADKYDGYKFVGTDPEEIPDTVSNGDIIKVNYERDTFEYTVEYYFEGIKDESKTEINTALFEEVINTYTDKVEVGYKFDRVEGTPLTITSNPANNVIRVYYVIDEAQTKEVKYTVEYYKDGILTDTDEFAEDIQVLAEEILIVRKDEINVVDKYEGYKLEKTDPEIIPDEIENNGIIKVYYIVDDENTKQLSYTVEYYKDGELADTEVFTEVVQILEDDTLEVKKDEINVADKYVGYEFDKTEPAEIPDTVNNGDVIKVFYVKGQFEYKVEYYYAGEIDDSKTDILVANYGDTIENVENKVIEGYKFDRAVNFPLVVSENAENNVIKIYYIIDNDNTKEISYTVEYYKDGVLDEESTQVVTKTVQVLQPDVLDVNKADINLVDKYDGYKLDAANTVEVPNIVNDGEVIKVYYIRKDASVVVKYYEQNSENALAEETTIEGKVFDEYSTEAKEIEGYTLVSTTENTEGQMTEEPIVVIYYYAKEADVVVKHIDKNTGEVIEEVVIPSKDGDIVETLPKDIPEYVLVESPEETTVQVEKEDIEVIYIYVKVSGGVIEKHIDVKSGEILETNTYEGNEGDPYSTTSKEFEGYDLVIEQYPENAEGVMTEEVIEVKYYYIRKATLKVEYVDINTGEVIEDETVIVEGHEGDTYEPEEKELDGYVLIEKPENEEVVLVVEPSVDEEGNIVIDTETNVVYKYAREAKVVVEHIDITTGEKLLEDEVIEGYEGKEYTTESKEIERYVLVEEPANKEGEMKVEEVVDEATGETTLNDTTVVTYKYDKQPATILVRYINKLTGEIFEEEVVEGRLDAPYTTEAKKFEGYRFLEEEYPENAIGVFTEEQIVINYYYMKISKILVYYVDSVTGELVSSEIEMDGYEGEDYVTTPIEIPGYILVEERYPENASGKYEEDQEVVYYYYVREAQVEVTYIDKETGKELAEKEIIEGKEGDKYTTEEKEIPYYKLEEVENPEGTMKVVEKTDEETGEKILDNVTEVIYKYVKQDFDMKIDKTITEILVNGENRAVGNNKLVKVEIHRKKIANAEVTIRYQIKVTNDGEIAGTAVVSERIPDNMYFYPGENSAWTHKGELAYLETEELKPGESATYEVVLHWYGTDEIGTYINNVEIVSTENKPDYDDIDSKDDKSEATAIIVTATGIEMFTERFDLKQIGNIAMMAVYAYFIIMVVKKNKK